MIMKIQQLFFRALVAFLTINFSLFPGISYSQEFIATPSDYHGYNISCHGGNDGSIAIQVVNGTPPYLYNWSNGSFSKNQSNLAPGIYSLTVTDADNRTFSMDVELNEPLLLEAVLHPKVLEGGYNISEMGGSDGFIESEIKGGVPPYKYLWTNSSTERTVGELIAGSYSLTVTDMNNCSATASVTLTEPSAFHIVSIVSTTNNGYNISCNEKNNGAINLTVTGGVPPYEYKWCNGYDTEDIERLGPGNYSVLVKDRLGVADAAQILLTEPPRLEIQLAAHVYSNGKNVSCYGCANGSITTVVTGGVAPYSYLWDGGANVANLSNLIKGIYSVTVTDNNGCTIKSALEIQEPDRQDWTMIGNAGINSTNQFIGTTDSNDVVFRSNNEERFRIKANGTINSKKMIGADYYTVMAAPNGDLLRVDPDGGIIVDPGDPTGGVVLCVPWNTCGNAIHSNSYLGTRNYSDLIIKTNAVERMRITSTGIVGIGIDPNTQVLPPTNNYKLIVGGTIGANEVWVSLGQPAWPDYVFNPGYKLTPIEDIEKFTMIKKHLPGMPSADEISKDGAVNLGLIQIKSLKEIEQLYLQLFKMNERLTELENQNMALQKKMLEIKN